MRTWPALSINKINRTVRKMRRSSRRNVQDTLCQTCLSQDRKLFDVGELSMFLKMICSDIKLLNTHKICWECKATVNKLRTFRNKAMTAQVLLADVAKKKNYDVYLQTLSSLRECYKMPEGSLILGIQVDNYTEPARQEYFINTDEVIKQEDETCIEFETNHQINEKDSENESTKINEHTHLNVKTSSEPKRHGEKDKQVNEKSYDEKRRRRQSENAKNSQNKKLSNAQKELSGNEESSQNDFEMYDCSALNENWNAYDDSDGSDRIEQDDSFVNENTDTNEEEEDLNTIENADVDVPPSKKARKIHSTKELNTDESLSKKEHKIRRESSDSDYEPTQRQDSNHLNMENRQYNKNEQYGTKINSKIGMYRIKYLKEEEMVAEREKKRSGEMYQTSVIKCEMCIQPFTDEKSLVRHLRNHDENLGSFACRICGLRFNFENACTSHTNKHYRYYACSSCDFQCDEMEAIMRHQETRHDTSVSKCVFCQRNFRSQSAFQLHERVAHRNVLECPTCRKTISSHDKLRIHIKKRHTDAVYVECEICHKKMKPPSLKGHLETHKPKKVEESAYCVECDAHFSSALSYRSHLLHSSKHVALEDKPHQCQHCGHRFFNLNNLKRHLDARHTDGMNYTCKACGKGFKTTIQLKYHVRRIHDGVKPPKNKICDVCSRRFQDKKTLVHHMRTHTGERPHACDHCDARFAQKVALTSHRRAIHKIKRADPISGNVTSGTLTV